MKYHFQPRWITLALALASLLGLTSHAVTERASDAKTPATAVAVKPALTVNATQPQRTTLAQKIEASGNLAAWQEASIGTEANGLRLAEVRVNVGDIVKRGQVLATFAPDMILADLAQTRANLAQDEAILSEAAANAQRARELQTTGALSAQQINQYLTAERTAQARVEAQRAMATTQQLRLAQTQVLAPDMGVISARSATVGAVLPAGQELFRMIRQGRLEWRAEVASANLARIKPGTRVLVMPADGVRLQGTVRMVAPTVDAATRMGIVYVDLPAHGAAKAGMFARGEFELGSGEALTLPQSAVLLRDGFSYVLRIGADSKVAQTKVAVGRRAGERIEITGGLDAKARVVAAGGGFLADGDTVRVLEAAPAPAPKTASSASGAQSK